MIPKSCQLIGELVGYDYYYCLTHEEKTESVSQCNSGHVEALEYALREYQRFNHVNNDLDAYLHECGEVALEGGNFPHPQAYGIPGE